MSGQQRWHKFDVETSRIMNCRSEAWDLSSGRRSDRKYWYGAVWTGKQLTVGHYESRSEGEKNLSPWDLARLWQVPDVVLIKRSATAQTDEKGSRLKGGIRRTRGGGGRGGEPLAQEPKWVEVWRCVSKTMVRWGGCSPWEKAMEGFCNGERSPHLDFYVCIASKAN